MLGGRGATPARRPLHGITVGDARCTCGTLLADLDVDPRVAMQIPEARSVRHHHGDPHPGLLGTARAALNREWLWPGMLVGRRGLEPRTYGLKVHSSAIELAARG
jgi:hypothetical protein